MISFLKMDKPPTYDEVMNDDNSNNGLSQQPNYIEMQEILPRYCSLWKLETNLQNNNNQISFQMLINGPQSREPRAEIVSNFIERKRVIRASYIESSFFLSKNTDMFSIYLSDVCVTCC